MTDPAAVPVEILDALLRLHGGIRRRMAHHLGVPLTVHQARLLWAVGETDAPARMSDLARRLDLNNRTVTPMVDALERERLVVRHPDPSDRRAVIVQLTPAGRNRRDAICTAQVDLSTELVGSLSPAEQAQLSRLLRRLAVNLGLERVL